MSVRPDRLVSQLQAARSVPLVLLVAPAGYGKTTLLEQWDAADERPFIWTSASGLSDEVDALDQPAVVVVDDWHDDGAAGALRDAGPAIAALCSGAQVAIAARAEPDLPLGRLRAQRKLLELRGPDLALRHDESASLLHDGGLDLAPGQVKTLVQRTEGWPAALVLAALSLRDRPDIDAAIAAFGGGDRLVADYLRDEVLGGLPPSALAFLRDTACLDRLSGPQCDAVADRRGSALILRELSRSGVGVLALDGNDEAYRYHPLLAGMLCAELERMDPDSLRERHRRATAWYAAEGETESALHHAVAAGDADAAGGLLWATAPRWASDGHVATLRRWLARFSDREIATTSTLGLAAALGHLAMGEGDLADRRTTVLSSRSELAGGLELLHAALGRDGVRAMVRSADRARCFGAEDTVGRAVSCLVAGVGRHLTGERRAARAQLEAGVRYGALTAPGVQALCLAQLVLLDADEDDWDGALLHVARARSHVQRGALADYPTMALVRATSAMVLARTGSVERATGDARRATRLTERVHDFAPWYDVEVRVVLARVALRLSDVARARTLLAEASRRLRHLPDAVVLHGWVDEVQALAAAFGAGAWARLTPAEARVLQCLPTHLSLRQIAQRIRVSENTVKSQAHAIYRKLDASSRFEAVGRAEELGLLDLTRAA